MTATEPFCTSLDRKISFYETPNGVEATAQKKTEYLPIKIPFGGFPEHFSALNIAQRVQQLVHNRLLLPECCSETNTVVFSPVPAEQRSIEKGPSIIIPEKAKTLCRFDGSICFVHEKTLFTWDGKSRTVAKSKDFNTNLSALSELPNGQLILGDEEGNVHFQEGYEKYTDEAIQNLLPLSPSRCIVRIEGKSLIVDVEKKTILQELSGSSPLVLGEDIFLTDEPLNKWKYHADKEEFVPTPIELAKKRGIERLAQYFGRLIKKLSPTKILLTAQNGTNQIYIVFDLLDGSADHYSQIQNANVALLNQEKTLVYGGDSYWTSSHRISDASFMEKGYDGRTCVSSMNIRGPINAHAPLSDGFLLCSTFSDVFLFAQNKETSFELPSNFISTQKVQSFKEMPNGSVLARLPNELVILKPILGRDKRPIDSPPSENTRYKSRLFVGEGTFSGVEALLRKHGQKHPDLGKYITATEYEKQPIDDDTLSRVQSLHERGVQISFGVDGTRIHEQFADRHFQRIHWNHPFGATPNKREEFEWVIPAFFKASNQIQDIGDRVHVTLDQKLNISRQKENPIVLGATEAGYRLIKKRNFGITRYPGYQHNKTGTAESFLTGDDSREFVFEKTGSIPTDGTLQERALALKDLEKKEYRIETWQGTDTEIPYFSCSTDADSSDYETQLGE